MRLKLSLIIIGLSFALMPLIIPAPAGMTDASWRAAGLASMMALWWLTEAAPLPATALVPVALGPFLGGVPLDTITRSYGDPLIFLFLGGFLLAKAIEKSGLHLRLAGALLTRAGNNSRSVLAAIMASTAFLSLWISNTASAMVMAPVAAAIAASQGDRPRLGTALMLGVAFAATIGGMGSLIGTPPNAIFAAYVNQTYGTTVGFAQWAAIGVPVALVLLLVTWLLLGWVTPSFSAASLSLPTVSQKTPPRTAERRVGWIAGLTACAWLARPFVEGFFPMLELSDAGIAITAALALFLVSDGQQGRLLDWSTAMSLRWDVLILFGGGLALAQIIQESGLADWIGERVYHLSDLPALILLFLIAAMIVFVGELASNTAMAAIFLPIAGVVAGHLGADPIAFLLPIALAASVGFMLPVATPPNAIVFANPSVTRLDMIRAGAPLDLIALTITVSAGWIFGPFLFRF